MPRPTPDDRSLRSLPAEPVASHTLWRDRGGEFWVVIYGGEERLLCRSAKTGEVAMFAAAKWRDTMTLVGK
jgi:hypothetical protein